MQKMQPRIQIKCMLYTKRSDFLQLGAAKATPASKAVQLVL